MPHATATALVPARIAAKPVKAGESQSLLAPPRSTAAGRIARTKAAKTTRTAAAARPRLTCSSSSASSSRRPAAPQTIPRFPESMLSQVAMNTQLIAKYLAPSLLCRLSTRRSVRQGIGSRYGDPNQLVSASRNPASVPSPTPATCPSGRISTAVGAVTVPSTGSSQTPPYLALIS